VNVAENIKVCNWWSNENFVLAVLPILAFGATIPPPPLAPIIDPEAYTVYHFVIPHVWAEMRAELLIQRETESMNPGECSPNRKDPRWQEVVDDYHRQNVRPWAMRPLMNLPIAYRMITRAEVRADDERLALKYPGQWQVRPESLEYVAVSAVGFNADHTKAYVYVRTRSHGNWYHLGKSGGTWGIAVLPFGCGGCVI
jgi:hypothetical protein